MKVVNTQNCERDDELIAFLYGELRDDESRVFRSHLHDCAACRGELASFRQVRESVVAWRDESLGGVLVPGQVADLSPALIEERPSALAALRKFFDLSPLWLKGALACASILLCLFAGLAVVRLRESPPPVIVTVHQAPSEEEINARVQERVQAGLKRAEELQAQPSAIADNARNRNAWRRTTAQASLNSPLQKARRPLSKTERQELAADLRLVFANDGDIDLLDDEVNQ